MRRALISLMLFCQMCAPGQTSLAPAAPPHVSAVAPAISVLTISITSTCPVGFSAKRIGGPLLAKVRNPQNTTEAHRLGIALLFQGLQAGAMQDIHVTVHGSAGAHIMLTQHSADAKETENFHLLRTGAADHWTPELWTRRLDAVQWISLDSVQFSDGTSWEPPMMQPCNAQIDPLLLVGSNGF